MIQFDVIGNPAPQGSHTAFHDRKHDRCIIIPAGDQKAHKAWRRAVREAAEAWLRSTPQQPLDEPLKIKLDFWFDLPINDKYRTRHAVSPDVDKICRATFDSLTDAKLIINDSRFFQVILTKLYCQPGEASGVRITIWPYGEAESTDREVLKCQAKEMRRTGRTAI